MKDNISDMSQGIGFNELEDQGARRILAAFLKSEQNPSLDGYSTDNLVIVPMLKGRSGAGIYKLTIGKTDYVLRMFSPLENHNERKREAHISRIAGENGVAPRVYYVDSELEGMVIEFLEGRTLQMADIKERKDLLSFVSFLQRVHDIPVSGQEAISHFRRGEEWLNKAKEKKASFPTHFETVYQRIFAVEDILSKLSIEKVLIHNDLIPPNIMTDGTSYKLIDWPASGNADPFWDLIDFSNFNNLDDVTIKFLLKAYLNREVREEEWDRFTIMRPVPSLVRVIGGFAFSEDVKSTDECDMLLKSGKLTSPTQMMEDFSQGKLELPQWEIALIFFAEAERQINEPEFVKSFQRLSELGRHYGKSND